MLADQLILDHEVHSLWLSIDVRSLVKQRLSTAS